MRFDFQPIADLPGPLNRALQRLRGVLWALTRVDGGYFMEASFIELEELSADPDAPEANRVRIYAKDSGAGKTVLHARFASGAVQTLATEP